MMEKFIRQTTDNLKDTGDKIQLEIDDRLNQQHQMIDDLFSAVNMI